VNIGEARIHYYDDGSTQNWRSLLLRLSYIVKCVVVGDVVDQMGRG